MSTLPKIFVFCNNAGCTNQGDWHSMVGIAEDGAELAGHICSQHGWATHDMGIAENGWKRDVYAKHYPNGFEVLWVEDPDKHEGLQAAFRAADAKDAAAKLGDQLVCDSCRKTRPVSPTDAALFLRSGWPECCGYTMTFARRKR